LETSRPRKVFASLKKKLDIQSEVIAAHSDRVIFTFLTTTIVLEKKRNTYIHIVVGELFYGCDISFNVAR
jgi:hypothetical protein